MHSPAVEDPRRQGQQETPRSTVRRQRPPGGKALERMAMFEAQRGLLTEPLPATPSGGPRERAPGAGDQAAVGFDEYAAELAATRLEAARERAGAAQAWRPLGPSVLHGGQTYGSGTGSRVDVSGRVSAVAVDPSDSAHVLVGAAGGGIWETHDRGTTWVPRGDGMSALAIGALAFDPTSPATVYACTGEGDFYRSLGQGVYRSTDGGTSWSLVAGAPFIGVGFHQLVVDRADGQRLYAATRAGLYVSADGGTTWSQKRTNVTWSVSAHPSGGTTEVLAGCDDGLFRSTDAGSTWTAVTLPGVPTPPGIQRLAVDHAPSDGDVAWAWAATDPTMTTPDGSQPTPRLWRRETADAAFAAVPVDPGVRTGQAWYDWHAHVAPDAPTTVYLGEIDLWRVDQASGGSATWTNLSSKTSGDSIHPDQHCLAFDMQNPDVVYAGSDGGLFRSPDRGVTWAALNNGLAITEIEYMAQDVGSAQWLLAGTQDNGTIRFVGRPEWDHVGDGDGGDCGADTVSPDHVYHSYFYMGLERSSDKGDTWTWVPTGDRDPDVYGQLFYPPVEARGATVAQAGESVFVSRDDGATFTEVLLTGKPVVSAMYLPTPDDVYVGTTNGRIFRISWSGSAWRTPTELTSPRTAYVSDLFVDAGNANRIWATYTQLGGGRVFRSDDGGSSWTDHSSGLPVLPINAVEVHADDADRVWVAADKGVYESRDGGETWSSVSTGLPNCMVADLLYHPSAHLLRAGTRNRGVWELVVDAVTSPICGVQWSGSLAANETKKWYTFSWPATWHVVWTVVPTTLRSGAPQVSWETSVERADGHHVTYWISVTNLTDQPVTFEGRYAILSYR